MGDRSEKTDIQYTPPWKCPFRITTNMKYTCFEGCEPVTTKISYDYPNCYMDRCPLYQYDTDKRSYICKNVEQIEGGIENE